MLKQNRVLLNDEALIGVQLVDRISVPSKRQLTDAGQMLVPCAFARIGDQLYTAGQLGLPNVDPKEVVKVFRDEADVFAEDSMMSFRSAPVTIGHPKDDKGSPLAVTIDNASELQVGMLEGMPVRDEDLLKGTLVLTARTAIDALEDGTQELSAGYTCDIEEIDGKYFQRNIKANHIAIVSKGRAGSSCRISDEVEDIYEADKLKTDDHPAPVREDFKTTDEFNIALADWKGVESNEPDKKALDIASTVDEQLVVDAKVVSLQDELAVQKQLVVDFKADAEKAELANVALKAELADAIVAASEGVIERCEAIENARLIADMRDLGDKSVAQIRLLVVQDQYPDKDLSKKSEPFIEAMFEMLIDQAKGDTPMSKLLAKQAVANVTDTIHVDPVQQARTNMIKRQTGNSK